MLDQSTAEVRIANILAQLERDTDAVVRGITLESLEVTNMDDDRRRFGRTVIIKLERLPGNDYLQATDAVAQ